MGETAEAAYEQQCINTDRFQVCNLRCHLLRRPDQHAADGFEFVVAPSTPDAAGKLLEPVRQSMRPAVAAPSGPRDTP